MQNNRPLQKNKADIDGATLSFVMVILAILLVIILTTYTYMGVVAVSNGGLSGILVGNNGGNGGSADNNNTIANYPFRQDVSVNISKDLDAASAISDIYSTNAALIDMTEGVIVASKGAHTTIYPASMTKVMTLITIYENLPSAASLNEVIEIKEIVSGHSGFGLKVGDKLTVKDLIYDAILLSDGNACLTLANYIADSEKNFVKLMNAKVKDMGLLEGDSETNPSTYFMNCTGIHEDNSYN